MSAVEIPARVDAVRPVRMLIAIEGRGRLVGPWSAFDVDGVQGPAFTVPWTEMAGSDRLRLGRALIRAAGDESAAAWSLLCVMLEVTGSAAMAEQAWTRMERLGGEDAPAWTAAVRHRIDEVRERRRLAVDIETKASVRRTRPHLLPVAAGGAVVPPRRPARTPLETAADRGALRQVVEAAVEGLGLEVVPTALVTMAGRGTLEEMGIEGAGFDRVLGVARARLGLGPDAALPAGGLAVVDPADLDVARILLARHGLDWPSDEPSVLVPVAEGWIAYLGVPDPERVRRWSQVLPENAAGTVLRKVEAVRVAARVAMLEAGEGRVPPWMVEGFAEAAAQAMIPEAPLEAFGRPVAVEAIRSGRHPGWVVDLDPSNPAWGADGPARRTSHLLMSRLLESGDDVLPLIVNRLASGADVDHAFRQATGSSLDVWLSDAADWCLTND
jgi:hypothetical protein